MKKLISTAGSAALFLLGCFVFYLILSGNYSHFLHPKFMLLTGISGTLFLTMGLVTFFRKMELKLSTVIVLIAFLLICLVAPSVRLFGQEKPPAKAVRETLNGIEYIPINIIELYGMFYNNPPKKLDQILAQDHFVFRGFVYRNGKLDHAGSFAVMRIVVTCCMADACAYGLRIKMDSFRNLTNNEWVKVYSRITRMKKDGLEQSVELSSFANSDVNADFVVLAEAVQPDKKPFSPFIFDWKTKEPYNY